LSLIPGDKLPDSDIQYIDILVHVIMYGTWFFIFHMESVKQLKSPNERYYLKYISVFILFGGLMEILQENLIPGRFGSWLDFLANAFGCLIAYALIFLVYGRKQKQMG